MATDYTGVSTRQLGEVYARHSKGTPLDVFADRIGRTSADLKRILVDQNYQYVGLDTADKICLGLGLTMGMLTQTEELVVVPAAFASASRRMAEDEFWAADKKPTKLQVERRAKQLVKLRGFVLGPMTERQQAQALRDKSRADKR